MVGMNSRRPAIPPGAAHANPRALERSARLSGGTASKPPQFQPYAAGNKVYGGGRPAPNVGMTANKTGYAKRDGAMQARRKAFLDRAKRFS